MQRMLSRVTEQRVRLRAANETDEAERVQVLTDRDVAREEREVVRRVFVRLMACVEATESSREAVIT